MCRNGFQIRVKYISFLSLTDTLSLTTPNFRPHQIDVHYVQQTSLTLSKMQYGFSFSQNTLYNHNKIWPHQIDVKQTSHTDWHTLSNHTKSYTLYNHNKIWPHQIDVKQTSLTDWHTLSNHTKSWPHQIDGHDRHFPRLVLPTGWSVHVQILNKKQSHLHFKMKNRMKN